jgi:hypothetical protein
MILPYDNFIFVYDYIRTVMADLPYMYAIVTGVFVVFTAILFGARAKRLSGRPIEDSGGQSTQKSREGAPI